MSYITKSETTKLRRLFPEIERAEAIFEFTARNTCDRDQLARATAAFNLILKQAAMAIVDELQDPVSGAAFLEEWRPKADDETWFGPEPAHFLRQVVCEQMRASGGDLHEAWFH